MSLEEAKKVCKKLGNEYCVVKCNDYDIMKYEKAKKKNKKIIYQPS